MGLWILLAVLLTALELVWATYCLKHMHYRAELDKVLAEPGEVITQTARIANHGRLPVTYAGLMANYPANVDFEEAPAWQKKYVRSIGLQKNAAYSLCLYPRSASRLKVRFSCRERGVYRFGSYHLEAGDLWGLFSRIRKGQWDQRVVIMPRRCEAPVVLDSLGGLLGNISVRRYLFEDPVLTVGCRDYTGREPMKSIAWKQTARTGKMLVKQYDHTADYHVTVALNLDGASQEQTEACFRIARTALEMLEKRRIAYEFVTNGDLFTSAGWLSWLPEGVGKRHFEKIMWGLGTARGVSLESFDQLVGKCGKRRRMALSYVLITPPLKEKDRESFRALSRLSEMPVCVLESSMEKEGENG